MSEKRERGTGSLKMRGRIWWCKYYCHGRPIEVSCDTTDEKEARKLLKRKLAEVETGTHSDSRNVRYEDLRESYFDDYVANKRKSLRRDGEGKPRLDAVNRLDGFFSGFRASEIDAPLIRRFALHEQERGLSNGSINRSISALRRMFHLAIEDDRLRTVPHFPMLKESAPRDGFLEAAGYGNLSLVLPEYLRVALALGFFTGMREGEVLALEWPQVDFLGNAIRLRAGTTKNDDGRTVPVVPQLRALLVDQRGKRQPGCPYVCFRLDRRGHAVKIVGFRKAWQSACVKAGLGKIEPAVDPDTGETIYARPRVDRPRSKPKAKMVYHGLIFHDLRRSAVRNLVRSGVPEKVAMQITGHKTRSVFDRYNIVSENDLADAAKKLAAFHGEETFGDNSGTMLHQKAAAGSAVN